MNGIKLCLETSSTRCSRIRPKPLGCLTSTAIATIALVSVCRPNTPPSTPPKYASSTSTWPASRSRPGAHHRGPVAVQHRPRRLVGPQPQRPLDPERGDASGWSSPTPQRTTTAAACECGGSRPRRDRRLTTADRALPTTAAQPPRTPAGAPRAPESVAPPKPLKVIDAGSLVRKPRQQLRVRARAILARLRHFPSLPELDRYPPLAQSNRDRRRPSSGRLHDRCLCIGTPWSRGRRTRLW